MRTKRSGQLDALRFTARKCGGEAIKREVIEADFIEELQAGANLFQNFVGDFCLRRRELQAAKICSGGFNRELAQISDVLSVDTDGAGFGAKPGTTAIGAGGIASIAAEEYSDMQLVLLAFQVVEKPFTPSKSLSGSPSRTSRRCSAVSWRQGTFVGIPRSLAHLRASCERTR